MVFNSALKFWINIKLPKCWWISGFGNIWKTNWFISHSIFSCIFVLKQDYVNFLKLCIAFYTFLTVQQNKNRITYLFLLH